MSIFCKDGELLLPKLGMSLDYEAGIEAECGLSERREGEWRGRRGSVVEARQACGAMASNEAEVE